MNERQAGLFWAKVTKSDGCWTWTAATNHGYGIFTFDKRNHRAHRLAYQALVGPIPDGLVLDHLCHNRDLNCGGGTDCPHRRCVNPLHLEPVSPGTNVLRGRGLTASQARRDTCGQGHPLSLVRGGRRCWPCTRKAARALQRRLKERFLAGDATAVKHGTKRGAELGCRCSPCRDAQRAYNRAYRQRAIGKAESRG